MAAQDGVQVLLLPVNIRRWLLITATGSTAIGTVALWAGAAAGNLAVGIICAAIAGPVAVYTFNAALGKVTLTSAGITSWTPLRRHHCNWTNISDVTSRHVQAKGGDGGSRVFIQRKDGRAFALAVPAGSYQTSYETYDQQLQLIRSRWDQAAWQALEDPGGRGRS